MSELRATVAAIGLAAPGISSWRDGAAILRGQSDYQASDWIPHKPALLPANERRRASKLVRLAFQAAEDAIGQYSGDPSQLAGVFASSGGDMDISTGICSALAQGQTALSPTQFHNSVHNAAAGYWSIATQARGPSTSLSAHDGTAAAGLLEALSLLMVDQLPVLLVTYDIPTPQPLHPQRPISEPFACALVLSPEPRPSELELRAQLRTSGEALEATRLPEPLERLRLTQPAARMLPILRDLANGSGRSSLTGPGYRLCVETGPSR